MAKPFFGLSRFSIRLGQQGKKIRPFSSAPMARIGGQALAHLGNPFLSLSLLGQRPAPQDSAHANQSGNPLLSRECYRCFCPLLGRLPLPAKLMEPRQQYQGKSQAKGVRQAPGLG